MRGDHTVIERTPISIGRDATDDDPHRRSAGPREEDRR